jgi:hypothetical protein
MKTLRMTFAAAMILATLPLSALADDDAHSGLPYEKLNLAYGLAMDQKSQGISFGAKIDLGFKDLPALGTSPQKCAGSIGNCSTLGFLVLHPELKIEIVPDYRFDLGLKLGSVFEVQSGANPDRIKTGMRGDVFQVKLVHEYHAKPDHRDASVQAVSLAHELQGRLTLGSFDTCAGAAIGFLFGKSQTGDTNGTPNGQATGHACVGVTGESFGRLGYDIAGRYRYGDDSTNISNIAQTVSWRPAKSAVGLDLTHETEKVNYASGSANVQSVNSAYLSGQF